MDFPDNISSPYTFQYISVSANICLFHNQEQVQSKEHNFSKSRIQI